MFTDRKHDSPALVHARTPIIQGTRAESRANSAASTRELLRSIELLIAACEQPVSRLLSPRTVASETQITDPENVRDAVRRGSRRVLSRGLATVVVATTALFVVSLLFASSSVTRGTLLTMLPFAAALAIAGLGQTLVVMQGGIDLSVAGGF